MNFDFSDDQRRLQEEVRRVLGDLSTSANVRRVLEGEAPFCGVTWGGLAGIGALGLAIPEEHGGAGMGLLELCLVAEEAGRSLAAVPLLSTVYLAAEVIARAGSEAQKARWLPRIASGEAVVSAVLDIRTQRVLAGLAPQLSGERLSGVINAVPDGMGAEACLLLAGGRIVLADLSGPGVERSPQHALDPTRPLARIAFSDTPVNSSKGALPWRTRWCGARPSCSPSRPSAAPSGPSMPRATT